MGKTSDNKKAHILKNARRVFASKGFKSVTMKDIVSACEISRGGLYLYYNNTSEIFADILRLENQGDCLSLQESLDSCHSATKTIQIFWETEAEELLGKRENLIVATYEFFVKNREEFGSDMVQKNFAHSLTELSKIIAYGTENGEFHTDPFLAAQSIILILEGLRTASTVMDLEEKFLDDQLYYILTQILGGKDETK